MLKKALFGLAGCIGLGLVAVVTAADDLPTPRSIEKIPLQGGGTYYRGPASRGPVKGLSVATPVSKISPGDTPQRSTPVKMNEVKKDEPPKHEQTIERRPAFADANRLNQGVGLNQGYFLNQGYLLNQGFIMNQGYSLNQTYAPRQGYAPPQDPTKVRFDDDDNPGSPFLYRVGPSGYPLQFNQNYYSGSRYSNQTYFPGFRYSQQNLNYSW